MSEPSGAPGGERFDGTIHELAALYALDALDEDETVTFEAHLASCEACLRDVDSYRETTTVLGQAVSATPPEGLRSSVLAHVSTTPQDPIAEPTDGPPLSRTGSDAAIGATGSSDTNVVAIEGRRTRTRRWLVPIAAAAALIVVVSAAVVVVNNRSDEVTIADVQQADDVVVATLAGDGEVTVSWSASLGRVAVEADEVDAVAADQVYELWAIVGETPVAAGLIEHDGGEVSAVLEFDGDSVGAWGITVEPDGGSPTPTEPIVFYGEVA